jgi:hypothetical protein
VTRLADGRNALRTVLNPDRPLLNADAANNELIAYADNSR